MEKVKVALHRYMMYVVECVKHEGYISAKCGGYTTAEKAWDFMMLSDYNIVANDDVRKFLTAEIDSIEFNASAEGNSEFATVIINHVQNLDISQFEEADVKYLSKIVPLSYELVIDEAQKNLAASMIRNYMKCNRQDSVKHLGALGLDFEVGEDIGVEIADIRQVTMCRPNKYSWRKGPALMYKVIGKDDVPYVFYTNEYIELNEFEFNYMTGKFKKAYNRDGERCIVIGTVRFSNT